MHMQPREMISGMQRWWQNWRRAHSDLSQLVCCGEYEAERMAHDLGLPVAELRKLAEHGPEAADLLTRRMAELNLDSSASRVTAGAFGFLTFTQCAGHCLKPMLLGRRVIRKWIALAAFALTL